MTTPQVAAQRLAGTALAPAGSRLVLAEWTAQGSAGDEPVYQAPLHAHPEDEAWYVLEGTLAVRVGEHVHRMSGAGSGPVPDGVWAGWGRRVSGRHDTAGICENSRRASQP